MLERTGDIWAHADGENVDAICVLTNMTVAGGKLIMSGGNAREARTHYPILPELWGQRYMNPSERKLAIYTPDSGPHVVAFPTKVHPSDNSKMDLIEECARELVVMANDNGWAQVVLPRPGCGLGGLKWEEVREVIAPIFDDRFTVFGYA